MLFFKRKKHFFLKAFFLKENASFLKGDLFLKRIFSKENGNFPKKVICSEGKMKFIIKETAFFLKIYKK